MKKILKILFLFLFVFLQSSCLRYHVGLKKIQQPHFSDNVFPVDFPKALYKTNIKILTKKYSGLMFFKRNDDNSIIHVVLMSEFGLKLIDMEIDKEGEIEFVFILDELNQEKMKEVLAMDMKILFSRLEIPGHETYFQKRKKGTVLQRTKLLDSKYLYYHFNPDLNQVSKIEYSGKVFKKVNIEIDLYEDEMPSHIKIKHKGLPLKIELKQIKL